MPRLFSHDQTPTLAALCSAAGVRPTQLAKELGYCATVVQRWITGEAPVPITVTRTLTLLADLSNRSDRNTALPSDPSDSHSFKMSAIAKEVELASSPSKVRVLSFFTGAGGLDLGFEQAGYDIVRASDIDEPSCKTLQLNSGSFLSPNVDVVCEDIRKTDLQGLPTNIDLIIGGPPCQSFSASGRRAGGAAGRLDSRGNLFESYCGIINHVRPKAFVFENVRGILSTNNGDDWKDIVAAFGNIGYNLSYRILDALDYGAPQQRERMFLVGTRAEQVFLFPQPTHGPDSLDRLPHLSSRDALHGINEDEDLQGLKIVDGKYAYLLPEVPPGQNYLFFTARRGYPKPVFAYRSRFSDFLYKADPDQPVKTLIAKPGKYTGPLHWDNRYFSVKEYMRLQGFPDGYQFHGSRDDVIRQIGNSVSPKIAYALALAVKKQIFSANIDIDLLPADQLLSFDKRKGLKAQKTRKIHASVASDSTHQLSDYFQPTSYSATISANGIEAVVASELRDGETTLTVGAPGHNRYVEFEFAVVDAAKLAQQSKLKCERRIAHKLYVRGFGVGDHMPQLIWNAVDDWVQRTSHYHSLFELYGHFTEPYPQFEIGAFRRHADSPIARFMEFASMAENWSRYLPKIRLEQFFQQDSGWNDFHDVATRLRAVRFDVRSHETNIAITPDQFIIAYPFTLPRRRQMNFSVTRRDSGAAGLAA